MSDLIDRAALREKLRGFYDITAVPATAVLDAAPTIECAACGNFECDEVVRFCDWRGRDEHHNIDGCSLFQRRQP